MTKIFRFLFILLLFLNRLSSTKGSSTHTHTLQESTSVAKHMKMLHALIKMQLERSPDMGKEVMCVSFVINDGPHGRQRR